MHFRRSLLLIAFLAALAPLTHAQPAKPTNVKATPGDKFVQISYDASPGDVSFRVYWSTTPHVTKLNTKSPSPMSFANIPGVHNLDSVPNLTNDIPYYFVITAVNQSNEESDLSEEVTVTPIQQAVVSSGVHSTGNPTSAAVQSKSNVLQASDANVQNPTMHFASFDLASYPILNSTLKDGKIFGTGTISYDPSQLDPLVNTFCSGNASAMENGSTYVVINVIKLVGPNGASQNVDSNNWYVYSKHKTFSTGFAGGWKVADFDGATRLYGAKEILLISILENDLASNDQSQGPAIDYKLTVTKEQATNVSDAFQLLGLVFPQGVKPGPPAADRPNYWACSAIPIAFKTSTIKFDLTYTASGNTPYTASQSFVNEGKEHWDFSFALPVKKASALQYNSTANTITASQINKTALYAVFDWYPYPVDLKNSKFNYIPSVFAGVAMNSQPLHSLIFGASIGTKFVQLYGGALLLKQQSLTDLAVGGTGNPAQLASASSYAYKAQFSVGVKISISAAASALNGSK